MCNWHNGFWRKFSFHVLVEGLSIYILILKTTGTAATRMRRDVSLRSIDAHVAGEDNQANLQFNPPLI